MVIAIDGPAGAGKSTVARAAAAALGFTYLDSGAMYRCVGLAAIERGVDLDDGRALGPLACGLEIELDGRRVLLDGRDVSAAIRDPAVTAAASRVSVHPSVREALVARQRQLITAGRYVAEGRDISTVGSPGSPLSERDERDENREHSALHAAPDAVKIDTTGLDLGTVVEQVVALARERGLT